MVKCKVDTSTKWRHHRLVCVYVPGDKDTRYGYNYTYFDEKYR